MFGKLAAGVCLLLVGAFSSEGQAASNDSVAVAARAQSAYFKGDAATLQSLVQEFSPWSRSSDETQSYVYALVSFRLLQHSVRTQRDADAKRAGESCVGTLDALLKRNPKSYEAYALQSACYGYLANLGGMAAIRNGSRSGKSIESALALAPQHPRVILIDGFGVYFRPKFVGGDVAKGCRRFGEAFVLFEAAGSGAASVIEWGHAEAGYWFGRCAQDAGKTLEARRAYERALQLAPDFDAARKALVTLRD